jgi:hypothetical protein
MELVQADGSIVDVEGFYDPQKKRRNLRFFGNPLIFSSRQKWTYAAIANFCIGVMPPSAMFGRSWL